MYWVKWLDSPCSDLSQLKETIRKIVPPGNKLSWGGTLKINFGAGVTWVLVLELVFVIFSPRTDERIHERPIKSGPVESDNVLGLPD